MERYPVAGLGRLVDYDDEGGGGGRLEWNYLVEQFRGMSRAILSDSSVSLTVAMTRCRKQTTMDRPPGMPQAWTRRTLVVPSTVSREWHQSRTTQRKKNKNTCELTPLVH